MTIKNHFGVFKPHTLTKHAILDVYLKAWGAILVRSFGQAWFVDAFAGEGQDAEGHPGSPLIAARAAEQINRQYFPDGITRGQGMRVIAFESEAERFSALEGVMKPFVTDPWWEGVAIIRKSTLYEKLTGVIDTIRDTPALYFLDPFGIDGLSAAVLPDLLKGSHNELLILFNDEGAVRLAGKVRAGPRNEDIELANAESRVTESLFGEEATSELRQEARKSAKRVLAGHKSNADAERIMDTAFGGDWWRPVIDATPEDRRQLKFVELYEGLLNSLGATRLLRFSINTPDGRHKYYLIHAAKDRRAYAVMKDAMHRARGLREEVEDNQSFLARIESGPTVSPIADNVCQFFAGQHVRWQGAKPSVKQYAIDETALWYHECEALKAELLKRGYTDLNERGKPKAPLSFTFPSI